MIPIGFITPDNFAHKNGMPQTRKHHLRQIHPALQANCGGSQMTYILVKEVCDNENLRTGYGDNQKD